MLCIEPATGVESRSLVKECKRDSKNQFLSYHLSGAREIEEYDLIAGLFNIVVGFPKHREELGRGWKRTKTSCQHPARSAKKK